MKKSSVLFCIALIFLCCFGFVACKSTQKCSITFKKLDNYSVVYDTDKYETKNGKVYIKKGGDFVFTTNVTGGEDECNIIVLVNGERLCKNDDGLYIVKNVRKNIVISLEKLCRQNDQVEIQSDFATFSGFSENGNLFVKINETTEKKFLIYAVDVEGNVKKAVSVSAGELAEFDCDWKNTKLVVKQHFDSEMILSNVEKRLINGVYANYYDSSYVGESLNFVESRKNNNAVNSPLIVQNPFGTDHLSVYFYFKTAQKRTVSYSVVTSNNKIFFRSVLSDFSADPIVTDEHEFLAHGLVSGKTSWIVVDIWNGDELEDSYCVECVAPNIEEIDDMYAGKQIQKTVYSDDALADGLYAFSLDTSRVTQDRSTNMAMMDNDGVIRWFVPMNDSFFHNIFLQEYAGQKCLVYAIDYHQIVYVNYLGQVVKIVTLDIVPGFSDNNTYVYFSMHHDFCFDDQGNIYTLVGRATSRQIEKAAGTYPPNFGNYVVRYNISKDTVEVVLDFNRSVYSNYTTTHESTLISDWFHPNSVQYTKDSQNEYLTISSRETSSIVKVKLGSVLTAPEAVVEVESEVVWFMSENAKLIDAEGTTLLLEKVGAKCLPILGQHTAYIHTTNIFSNRVLQEGQYYLSVFSNNAKVNSSDNVWNIDESIDQTTVGDTAKGFVFLIDEQNKTYELVLEMDFSRSIYMGSLVLLQNGNWQAGSTRDMVIAECTNNGTKIVEFRFFRLAEPDAHIQGLGYRAIKINL